MAQLQKVNCYNCGSGEYEYYDDENGFNLVKCKGCGLLYVNPRPSDFDVLAAVKRGVYSHDLGMPSDRVYEDRVSRYLKILRDFYSKENFMRKGVTWLDIGCGYGEFLKSLKIYSDGNIDAVGLEPDSSKVKFAQGRGLNVMQEETQAYANRYDFVSMLNVFSHLSNPVDTLIRLKKTIKDNGELFLETGHSSHLAAKYHHKPYYLPDHLSFANREIVTGIMNRVGFEAIKIKIYRHESFVGKIFQRYPNRDMWIRAGLRYA